MKSNRQTLDLNSVLIRQLNIKNQDNTSPPANLSILTDGNGGTYLSSIFNVATPTGFNEIRLLDTGVSTIADLSYNVLGFRSGQGTTLFFDDQNNVVINNSRFIASTFSFIGTQDGIMYADKMGGGFNISTSYGVNLDTDNLGLGVGNGLGLELLTGPSARRIGGTIKMTF